MALSESCVSFIKVDFCSEVRYSYWGDAWMISRIPYNIDVRAGSGDETVDSDTEFIAARRAADGEL